LSFPAARARRAATITSTASGQPGPGGTRPDGRYQIRPLALRDRSGVMRMPQQKQGQQGAVTWREVRAKAVKEGRLNEEALEAHKRRMIAEEHAHTERQQDDKDGDA